MLRLLASLPSYNCKLMAEENMYGMLLSTDNLILPLDYQNLVSFRDRIPILLSTPDFPLHQQYKAKIVSHPTYPRLLHAYIDCHKVGAPPEIACLLEEIRRENEESQQEKEISTCFGADPELDEFMEAYCEMLVKYKSDLWTPYHEASSFFNNIQLQLCNLCAAHASTSKEDGMSSDDELNWGEPREVEDAEMMRLEDKGVKDMLLRRFGSHIGSLKLEFSKKKKKGKLPKEGRKLLLQWWNLHYKWPYPTEADKAALAETTGLDPKQINNWFINQRKRHWKPSETMQFGNMAKQF